MKHFHDQAPLWGHILYFMKLCFSVLSLKGFHVSYLRNSYISVINQTSRNVGIQLILKRLLHVVLISLKFNEISIELLCQRFLCMELHKLDRVLIHKHTAGSRKFYDLAKWPITIKHWIQPSQNWNQIMSNFLVIQLN